MGEQEIPTVLHNGNSIKLNRLSDHDLLVRIAVMVECLPEIQRRLAVVEAWRERSQERWEQHDKEHKDLNVKKWAADLVASALAVVGIVVKSPIQ